VVPNYVIRPARAEHIERLADIELAAARLLVGHAPEHVLLDTTPISALRSAVNERRLWVATVNDEPIGFAHVEVLAGDVAHLEEIDVHPRHGRRGVGTALVREVCAWIRASPFRQLTLTNFRAPSWNIHFYAGLGFVEVPRREWRTELERVVANETARGLDPTTRVVMAWSPG
jgi:GNAT superfamily N-acetyltransferase